MNYFKFDTDWMHDPKIIAFKKLHGKAALVDVVNLYCAWGASENGEFSLKDPGNFAVLSSFLGKGKARTIEFLDRCAEVGIIDADAYRAFGRVACRRSIEEAETRARRRIYAKDASDAAKRKRDEERLRRGG